MPIKMKNLPVTERPYEKLEQYGEKNLTNAELLAIIIKTGTKKETSVAIAQKILKLNNTKEEDLNFIQTLSIEELMQIKGIGKVKAIQLKAVGEIAIRMFKKTNFKKEKITKPQDIARILMSDLKFEKNEKVKVVILTNKNEILAIKEVAAGGTNFANVSIKDILYEPIKLKAPKIILVHNHPSGDSKPSNADIELTEKVRKAAEIMGIELLDHIVIGNMNYTSIFTDIFLQNKNIAKGE